MKKGGIDGLKAFSDKLDRQVSINVHSEALKYICYLSMSNDYSNEWISEKASMLAFDDLSSQG